MRSCHRRCSHLNTVAVQSHIAAQSKLPIIYTSSRMTQLQRCQQQVRSRISPIVEYPRGAASAGQQVRSARLGVSCLKHLPALPAPLVTRFHPEPLESCFFTRRSRSVCLDSARRRIGDWLFAVTSLAAGANGPHLGSGGQCSSVRVSATTSQLHL